MKTVTVEKFLTFDTRYGEDRIRRIAERTGKTEFTALDILAIPRIPNKDRLRAVLRVELIDAPILHEFACRCAERDLSRMDNPDPRSIAGIAAKRAWLCGEITDEQLLAAWSAALSAASSAASSAALLVASYAASAAASAAALSAALSAASSAASSAALLVASYAASAAASAAALSAALSAASASASASASDAASAAARYAAGCAERKWQVAEIKRMLQEVTE